MAKAATPRSRSSFRAPLMTCAPLRARTPATHPCASGLWTLTRTPNQPRTTFDQAELQQLADTITMLGGVLQPIGLRAPVAGRYQLVFGARRFRASKMLALADIPAIIVADDQAGLAAQVIENQSRANLTNSDLAGVIGRLSEQGMKGKQIATVCGLTDHAVTMFRSAPRLPPFLAQRMDRRRHAGDLRAVHRLAEAASRDRGGV